MTEAAKVPTKVTRDRTPWFLAATFIASLLICVLITGVPLVKYAFDREKASFLADVENFNANGDRLQIRSGLSVDLAAQQKGILNLLSKALTTGKQADLERASESLIDFEKVGQLQWMEFIKNDGTIFLSTFEDRVKRNVTDWVALNQTTESKRFTGYVTHGDRLFAVASAVVRFDGDRIGTLISGLEIDNRQVLDFFREANKSIQLYSGAVTFASTFTGENVPFELVSSLEREPSIISVSGERHLANRVTMPVYSGFGSDKVEINIVTASKMTSFVASLKSIGKIAAILLVPCVLIFGVLIFTMSNKLARSNHSLSQFNVRLEDMVADRTKTVMNQQKVLEQQSKMSALGEMAGGIAHEINNPLAIISGNAFKLRNHLANLNVDAATLAPLTTAVEKIEGTVGRITKIIHGMRQFTRQDDKDPLAVGSLNALIAEAVDLCQEKIKHYRVSVTSVGIPDNIEVLCRASSVLQVFVNLIGNSIDATEHIPRKWIRFGVRPADNPDFVAVTVTDCGDGIPQEIREKILQPFFTTKDVGKGTGLGLSICRGIAESHGGRFFLQENSPNTCFVFELPLNKAKQEKIA